MIALVTGGASSGKSAFAERLATSLPGPYVYLATMQSGGDEAAARIKRHRAQRAGKGFITVERPRTLEGALDGLSELDGALPTVLLEDLGNLTANELFGENPRSAVDVAADIRAFARCCANLVIVTNEIGSDGVAYDGGTRDYLEFLGAVSCACAAEADAVVEVACGIPQVLKGSESVEAALAGRSA